LNIDPNSVEAGTPVTVSINVTYFLGIHSVLLEFDGSNITMTPTGNEYSVTFNPPTAGNYELIVYMESNVHTWNSTAGSLEVTEPPPTTTTTSTTTTQTTTTPSTTTPSTTTGTGTGGVPIDATTIIIIIAAAGVIIIVIIIITKKGKS